MRNSWHWLAALAMIVCAWMGEAATAKKSPGKKAPAKSTTAQSAAAKSTGVRKTGPASKRAASAGRPGTKKGAQSRVTWRNRQTVPTPERYKEIQGALASKGYLSPDLATGQWSDESSDALRRFQSDQNLEPNGKINSRSLIELGLGPRHEEPTPANPAVPLPPVDHPGQ